MQGTSNVHNDGVGRADICVDEKKQQICLDLSWFGAVSLQYAGKACTVFLQGYCTGDLSIGCDMLCTW
jgi:hypothetical protein